MTEMFWLLGYHLLKTCSFFIAKSGDDKTAGFWNCHGINNDPLSFLTEEGIELPDIFMTYERDDSSERVKNHSSGSIRRTTVTDALIFNAGSGWTTRI